MQQVDSSKDDSHGKLSENTDDVPMVGEIGEIIPQI
jgi:hypothetical protein